MTGEAGNTLLCARTRAWMPGGDTLALEESIGRDSVVLGKKFSSDWNAAIDAQVRTQEWVATVVDEGPAMMRGLVLRRRDEELVLWSTDDHPWPAALPRIQGTDWTRTVIRRRLVPTSFLRPGDLLYTMPNAALRRPEQRGHFEVAEVLEPEERQACSVLISPGLGQRPESVATGIAGERSIWLEARS